MLQAGADPFGVCLDEVLSGTEARINGRATILVGTNNYLGLTFDPECMAAAVGAIRDHGTGTTGSRIANGTYGTHRELEAEIARFLNRRSAMIFPTGYQANLGMLVGLAGPRDVILMDADFAFQHLRWLPAQRRDRGPLPAQRSGRSRPSAAADSPTNRATAA